MRKFRLTMATLALAISACSSHISASAASRLPSWFLRDVKIAAHTHFPVRASGYGLWLTQGPLNLSHEWVGGYTGTVALKTYSFYSGSFSMAQLYASLTKPNAQTLKGSVHSIFVLEKYAGSMAHWIHAESVDLGNGGFIAFANGQVITNDLHAGVDIYTVVPVKGIVIPGPVTN